MKKLAFLLAALACAGPLAAADTGKATTTCDATHGGETARVATAIAALRLLLDDTQRAAMAAPLARDTAIHWSNLPVGVVPRRGVRLGDLDTHQAQAAREVFTAALSTCGLAMLDAVRRADDFLIPFDRRPIGWDSRNYFLTVLGDPAATAPWMLQVGGHHLAYNFTFNGTRPGATPLFFGAEPIRFTLDGAQYEPLASQSAAMHALAVALAAHPAARLPGTYTDVLKGVVFVRGELPQGGVDNGFPHSYPTGTEERGIRYSALDPAAQRLVKAALRSYAALPGAAIAQPLVAAYESDAALRDTFVGFSGSPDFDAKGAYVRIDGPRIWMEFVVQPAVAQPADLHYHALWRDKQADYGGEFAQ